MDLLPRNCLDNTLDWVTLSSPDWLLDRSQSELLAPSTSDRAYSDLVASELTRDQLKSRNALEFYLSKEQARPLGRSDLREITLTAHDLSLGYRTPLGYRMLRRVPLTDAMRAGDCLLISIHNSLQWAYFAGKSFLKRGQSGRAGEVLKVNVLYSEGGNRAYRATADSREGRTELTALQALQWQHWKARATHNIYIYAHQVRSIVRGGVDGLAEEHRDKDWGRGTDSGTRSKRLKYTSTSFERWDLVKYWDRKQQVSHTGWIMHAGARQRDVQVWFPTVTPTNQRLRSQLSTLALHYRSVTNTGLVQTTISTSIIILIGYHEIPCSYRAMQETNSLIWP